MVYSEPFRCQQDREQVKNLNVDIIAELMMSEKTVRSTREDHTKYDVAPLSKAEGIRLTEKSEHDVNFDIRPGEIVALAGPVGSGKEDLAMILAKQQEPVAGTISSPMDKFPKIGFVPTDRHSSGYIGLLGVRENVTICGLEILSGNTGFINRHLEVEHVSALAKQTNVISSSLEQAVSQLSGGDQQKVVFARSLCRSPDIVVAMSPTRGVDVGAKEQLYALLRDLAKKGLGVVVSGEEDEIEQLANRVVIVFKERIVDELVGDYSMKYLILHMEGVT